MLDSLLQLIHVLASMVWLGGMFFAHFCLRPAAQQLEPPVRIGLLCGVLQRFFAAVTVAIAALLASGIWMLGRTARQVVQSGGQFSLPLDWALMVAIGLVMTGIFGYIRLVLFKQLVLAKEVQSKTLCKSPATDFLHPEFLWISSSCQFVTYHKRSLAQAWHPEGMT